MCIIATAEPIVYDAHIQPTKHKYKRQYKKGHNKLYISDLNVRKEIDREVEEDETSILSLSADIRKNGLINPITVRKKNDKYEIIAGQRRYLACKQIDMKTIKCNILDINDEDAEMISLSENIQRNKMTQQDKCNVFFKMYNKVNKDINELSKITHLSAKTLKQYIQIQNNLSPELMTRSYSATGLSEKDKKHIFCL